MLGKPCNLCNLKIFNKVFSWKIKPQILTITRKRVWKKCKNLRLHRLHRSGVYQPIFEILPKGQKKVTGLTWL
jgi:hypothetical protein